MIPLPQMTAPVREVLRALARTPGPASLSALSSDAGPGPEHCRMVVLRLIEHGWLVEHWAWRADRRCRRREVTLTPELDKESWRARWRDL